MCMKATVTAGALPLLFGAIAPAFSRCGQQEKDTRNPQQGPQQGMAAQQPQLKSGGVCNGGVPQKEA